MKKRGTETTTPKQRRGHQFEPGRSGNPAGRPKGARHKYTMAAMALLDGESEALTRTAINKALAGDMVALRLCLERIVSPVKERPITLALPKVKEAADLPKFTAALLAAVGGGEIDPGQAASVAKIVETHRSALEIAEIDSRLRKIEEAMIEKRN